MPTVIVILAIWLVLSLPLSLLLGSCLRHESGDELLGMDGDVAVFRRPDGRLQRVVLGDRAVR